MMTPTKGSGDNKTKKKKKKPQGTNKKKKTFFQIERHHADVRCWRRTSDVL
jgi:hypothetical protein